MRVWRNFNSSQTKQRYEGFQQKPTEKQPLTTANQSIHACQVI
jgi:hypothetical protein